MSQLVDRLLSQATTARNNGEGARAVKLYQEAANLSDQAGEEQTAAEAIYMMAVSYKTENDFELAVQAFKDASRRFHELGSLVDQGRVERDLGLNYDYAGRPDEALPWLKRSVETLEQTNAVAELGISEAKLGVHYGLTGHLEKGVEWIEQGLTNIRKAGQWFYEMTALRHLAQLRILEQNYPNALKNLEAGLKLIKDSGEPENYGRRVAQIRGLMSYCQLKLGQVEAAQENFAVAQELIKPMSPEATAIVLADIHADEILRDFDALQA